jgi:hypothetical protein
MVEMARTRSSERSGQIKSELDSLIQLFKTHSFTSYLEIGARHGDTFYSVVMAMPKGSRAVCVDLPNGLWGNSRSLKNLESCCNELTAQGYKIDLILGDSTKQAIIDKVKKLGPFDAALIDGDHRYDGVKKDWLNYGPMCSLVAFHDIVGHGQRHSAGIYVEVPRLWGDIKQADSFEFVEVGSKMGIGVIKNAVFG